MTETVSHVAIVLTALYQLTVGTATAEHQQPAYRGGVVLVPVAVRVVDSRGEPVVDLEAGDFEVFEQGVRQTVKHFATTNRLEPWSAPRSFCFLLGRGHLNQGAKAIDAVIEFVRARVMASDRVCVIAYRKATELTTRHDAIVGLLERFRDNHDAIEAVLESDVRVANPMLPLPDAAKAKIDEVFAGAAVVVHDLPDSSGAKRLGFSDGPSLEMAIAFLSALKELETNLIMITRRADVGVGTERFFSQAAAAAHVTLSVIPVGSADVSTSHSRFVPLAPAFIDNTGGVWSYDPAKALDGLLRSTRFEYMLGFTPSDDAKAGEFRAIRVNVTRPHTRVLYQHAYVREDHSVTLTDVAAQLREARIRYAAASNYRFKGIPVVAEAAASSETGGDIRITINLDIDPYHVAVPAGGPPGKAILDAAVFQLGEDGGVISRRDERLEIGVDGHQSSGSVKKHVARTIEIHASELPAFVKVVLFDYASDRLGSVVCRVTRR